MMSENGFIIVECSGTNWKFANKADVKVICFLLLIKLSQSLEIAAT